MAEQKTLRLVLPPDQLSAFFPLLQQGIWLHARIGCSVTELLTGQFGIAEQYLVERITTLFVDGKAIDDPQTCYVNDRSTLALSSAMPGLVGATMRRGGHLAAMRGAITYREQHQARSAAGRIRIKLFNMVMAELGALLLGYGICLSRREFERFMDEKNDSFRRSSEAVMPDGRLIDPAGPLKNIRPAEANDEILLKVAFQS